MANEINIVVAGQNRAGSAMSSATQQADQLGRSTKRVGDIATGIIASQVFTRIADAAKRAFTSTISAAVDLTESINATNVVFGAAADDVLAIGANASQSMGLSQQAFNAAAVQFSAFAKTVAGEGGDVSGVVEDLTGRAADFASVMNLDVSEALRLFQSGLAGETEPLRRYGIDVSAAAVQTFAWSNGIAEAGTQLTEQEKVQARYGSIMQQTSLMAGDFANTSDDLANASRRAKAELENTQASMGQNLLPVLAAGAGLLSDVLLGFQQLPGPVQAAAGILAALGTTAAAAALGMRALGISMTAVKAALGPIGIALAIGGAIIGGLAALGKNSKQSSGDVDALTQSLERGTGAITANTREQVLLDLQQRGVTDSAKDLGVSVGDLTSAWLGDADALDRVNGQLQRVIEEGTRFVEVPIGQGASVTREELSKEAEAAKELAEELAAGNITTEEAVERARELGVVTGETTGQVQSAADAAAELEEITKATSEAVDKLRESLFETGQAAIDLEDRQDALAEAVENVTEKSQDAESTDRDRRAALRDVASASHDLIDTMIEQGAETDDVVSATEDARRKFLKAAEAAGLNANAAEKLADKYGLVPRDVKTAVELIGAERAKQQAAGVRAALAALHDKEIQLTITENRRTGRGPQQMRAGGGPVGGDFDSTAQGGGPRGQRVMVGELRPEVVELPLGSRVIPSVDQASDRNQMGGGVGEQIITIRLEGTGMLSGLRKEIRVQGGVVQDVLGS